MRILPYENLVYESRLTERDIKKSIARNIEPKKAIRFPFVNYKPYEGFINENNFEIRRNLKYNNSFRPLIKGQIVNTEEGTQVIIEMKMREPVNVLILIFLGGLGLAFIVGLIAAMKTGIFSPTIFFLLGMLFFVYLITFAGFKMESNRSKRDMEKILNGKIIANAS